MNRKKHKSLVFFMFILGALMGLTGCTGNKIDLKKSFDFLSKQSEENLNDLSLTIYYMAPNTLTNCPVSIECLVNSFNHNENYSDQAKVVISGRELLQHMDLFEKMSNAVLVSARKKEYMDARICCVFESKKHGKLFELATGGCFGSNMFINGVQFKEDTVFYEIIKRLIPGSTDQLP